MNTGVMTRCRMGPALMLGIVLLMASGLRNNCQAQSEERVDEYRVKAAFLYKFIGYVEWPDTAFSSAAASFNIGVLGADDLARELEGVISGRMVNGRQIILKKLKQGDSVKALHMLFVGHGMALPMPPSHGTLVVTETERGLTQGSSINFVIADQRVRFEIALGTAEQRGLRLSSRLLAVAQQVLPGAP